MQTTLCSFSYKGLPFCKRCGSSPIVQDGRYKRQSKQSHKYRCRRCGFGFVWTSDLPQMRHSSDVVAFAVELYSRVGTGLRTTAQMLEEHFEVKISYEAIRQWVLKCGDLKLPTPQPEVSTVWRADETYVKVKGEGHWLWLVYCHRSGAILSWHLSKERTQQDAIALLRGAKENAGMRPRELITDGLWEYRYAARKVFGSRYVRHAVSSGFGENAPIERVNEEVKRRVKWFRTFQVVDCAKVSIGLWVFHWNFRRRRGEGSAANAANAANAAEGLRRPSSKRTNLT
jgi:putative transposase